MYKHRRRAINREYIKTAWLFVTVAIVLVGSYYAVIFGKHLGTIC